MNDKELCEALLKLESPWKVGAVEVSHEKRRVDIELEHEPKAVFCCPECGEQTRLYDHAQKRSWRHLDAFEFHTYIHARTPRVQCPKHGVRNARLPWAQEGARFTEVFEKRVIETLQCVKNITAARRLLDLSWDQVYAVLKRAVERGLARRRLGELRQIGVDEKAWRKGHSYFTVLVDLERRSVIDLARDRKTSSLCEIYESLPEKALETVEAVAMDMWPAYVSGTLKWIKGAASKIVHDRFHCVQMLLEALDKVRRKEMSVLDAIDKEQLKDSRWALGKNPENLTQKQRWKLAAVLNADLASGRAWALKENFRKLWQCASRKEAQAHFDHWIAQADASEIGLMQKVAAAFSGRKNQILNWFSHSISTGIVEALNAKIMTIKRLARGHRNFANLKASILFFLGNLNLSFPNHPTHELS